MKKESEINKIFNDISNKYDFMNNLISLFTHKFIKKNCIKMLNIKNNKVLDICCGTGDLARITKQISPNSDVTGIDFSENMLEIAQKQNPKNDIQYILGNATELPFENNSFEFATIGFGLRNIENKEKAVQEIYRVLKPKGYLMHLDFGEKNFFDFILNILIIFFSKIFTKNTNAYKYLVNSKKEFLAPDELIKFFSKNNFNLIKQKYFMFKTISCIIVQK